MSDRVFYNGRMEPLNKNKKNKVLFVVAHKDFRDEEYFITLEVLEKGGVSVETASSDNSPAIGVKGGEAKVDITLSVANPENYDAIVIVGGRGIRDYFNDPDLKELITGFNNKGKKIAAICAAPVVLAKAGVLKGKEASVWHTEDDMEYADILKEEGADFIEKDIVVDGNVITARDPESAAEFGKIIVSAIN